MTPFYILPIVIIWCTNAATDCGDNCTQMWECESISGYPNGQKPLGAKHFLLNPSYAYVWTTMNFSVSGRLKKASFHSSSKGEIVVTVWRNVTDLPVNKIQAFDREARETAYEMTVVGKAFISCDEKCLKQGTNTILFEPQSRIWVNTGDYFGTLPSKYIYRYILQSTSRKKIWEHQDNLPLDTVLTADDEDLHQLQAIPYGRANSVTYANTPVGSNHKFLFKAKSLGESEFAQPSISLTVECWCPENCKDMCDMYTGYCKMCKSGWTGFQCKVPCLPYTWGEDCNRTCSANCRNKLCDPIFGICTDGCHSGFVGKFCTENCTSFIEDGYYLLDHVKGTQKKCGHCKDMKLCDCESGICTNGCAPGYKPPICTDLCEPGYFGLNCQLFCGNCDQTRNCRPTDGHCTNGCQEGWTGTFCTISTKCEQKDSDEE